MSVPRQSKICYWSACQSSEHNPRGEGRKKMQKCRMARNILLYMSLIPKLCKQRLGPSHRMALQTAPSHRAFGEHQSHENQPAIKVHKVTFTPSPFPWVHYYDLTLLEQGQTGQNIPFSSSHRRSQRCPRPRDAAAQHPSTSSQHVFTGISHTLFLFWSPFNWMRQIQCRPGRVGPSPGS